MAGEFLEGGDQRVEEVEGFLGGGFENELPEDVGLGEDAAADECGEGVAAEEKIGAGEEQGLAVGGGAERGGVASRDAEAGARGEEVGEAGADETLRGGVEAAEAQGGEGFDGGELAGGEAVGAQDAVGRQALGAEAEFGGAVAQFGAGQEEGGEELRVDGVAEAGEPVERALDVVAVLRGQGVHEIERGLDAVAQEGFDAAQDAGLVERAVEEAQHGGVGALDADLGLGDACGGEAAGLVVGEGVGADFHEKGDGAVGVFARHDVEDLVEARVGVEGGVDEADLACAALAEDADAGGDIVGGEAGGGGAADVVAAEGAAEGAAAVGFEVGHAEGVGDVDGVVGRGQEVLEGFDGARAGAFGEGAVGGAPDDAAEGGGFAGAEKAEHGGEDGLAFAGDPCVGGETGGGGRGGEERVGRGDVGAAEGDLEGGQALAEEAQETEGAFDVPEVAGGGEGVGLQRGDVVGEGEVGGGVLTGGGFEDVPVARLFRAFERGAEAGGGGHEVLAGRGGVRVETGKLEEEQAHGVGRGVTPRGCRRVRIWGWLRR